MTFSVKRTRWDEACHMRGRANRRREGQWPTATKAAIPRLFNILRNAFYRDSSADTSNLQGMKNCSS
jgi:hypothetical protein